MEAENVSQLKYLLEMELDRLRDRTDVDITLFLGVDGRIFTTSIPEELDTVQYRLLNTFKNNIPSLCSKLKGEDLEVSIERWQRGMAVVASVGDNAFLASLLTKKAEISETGELLEEIVKTTKVLKHIFEQKDFDEESMEGYPDNVKEELDQLSRQLFVDRFKHTKKYKRNMEILNFIKDKIEQTVGLGSVDEIISVTFNELGTSAPYMEEDMWTEFLDRVVDNHLKQKIGDVQAEEYKKQWKSELQNKLKAYL